MCSWKRNMWFGNFNWKPWFVVSFFWYGAWKRWTWWCFLFSTKSHYPQSFNQMKFHDEHRQAVFFYSLLIAKFHRTFMNNYFNFHSEKMYITFLLHRFNKFENIFKWKISYIFFYGWDVKKCLFTQLVSVEVHTRKHSTFEKRSFENRQTFLCISRIDLFRKNSLSQKWNDHKRFHAIKVESWKLITFYFIATCATIF